MKTLKDYPVSYPYGATSYPYSASSPHRGDDIAAPSGTPIVIGITTIGLVGSTGLSSGPHTHIQAGTDAWAQQTVDPAKYLFKGGTVTQTGTASEWGKYVIIKTADGTNVVYAHLSKISTRAGKVIGDTDMYKGKTAKQWYDLSIQLEKAEKRALKAASTRYGYLNDVAVAASTASGLPLIKNPDQRLKIVQQIESVADSNKGKYVEVTETLFTKVGEQ